MKLRDTKMTSKNFRNEAIGKWSGLAVKSLGCWKNLGMLIEGSFKQFYFPNKSSF